MWHIRRFARSGTSDPSHAVAHRMLCMLGHIRCFACCAGEVLGCTAPVVADNADAIVFVADGRFHLEAIMIANPLIPAYR